MFAKFMMMSTNMDDNESSMSIVFHPKAVKEIFLDCTASFDYTLNVTVDGRELKNLDPNVYYDGYYTTFYWNDSFEYTVGTRVVITLTFWYKDKMVKYFNGTENIRRDEWSQSTEHWTYGEDEQFHIDVEDVDCIGFLEMLKPEWRMRNSHVIKSTEDNIIDVEYTEVNEEETKWIKRLM